MSAKQIHQINVRQRTDKSEASKFIKGIDGEMYRTNASSTIPRCCMNSTSVTTKKPIHIIAQQEMLNMTSCSQIVREYVFETTSAGANSFYDRPQRAMNILQEPICASSLGWLSLRGKMIPDQMSHSCRATTTQKHSQHASLGICNIVETSNNCNTLLTRMHTHAACNELLATDNVELPHA